MLLFFLSLTLLEMPDWHVGETGIFQPIQQDEAVVDSSGHVYVVNFPEAEIMHFDANGKRLGTIGRKGKGPGEFTYPRTLLVHGEKLYVSDILNKQMSVFDRNGTYQTRFLLPYREMALAKIKGGWIYGNWNSFMQDGPPAAYWASEDFSETREIYKFKEKCLIQGMMTTVNNGKRVSRYSPINSRPIMVASPDGSKVYITDMGKARILVIDGEKGTLGEPIEYKARPIPFDSDWADEEFKKRMEGRPKGKTDKIYPDNFPFARGFRYYNDTLILDRWRGKPDDNHWELALTAKGKETSSPVSWKVLERLIGVADGNAYVTLYDDETEEAGFARVDVTQLTDFIAANPINYDGDIGYSITISN